MVTPSSSYARIVALISIAMVAFAGNSLLCRAALKHSAIDAASFTTIRLISGAIVLWLAAPGSQKTDGGGGNWRSAIALFIYAAGFSFAYTGLPAATGALLLFGAVQTTMIGHGLCRGERLTWVQWAGLLIACGGLAGLLQPGISSPPLAGAIMMLGAGVAWGIYSLRGQGAGDPTRDTAGNFLRAAPLAMALSLLTFNGSALDQAGFWYAVSSGALASAAGYVIWYTALPALTATQAATVQLSVPVIAAAGGTVLLGEPLTQRLALASAATLGGIALVILAKRPGRADHEPSRRDGDQPGCRY